MMTKNQRAIRTIERKVVYMYVHVHMCMYVCMYVCMYSSTHVHTHVHTCTCTRTVILFYIIKFISREIKKSRKWKEVALAQKQSVTQAPHHYGSVCDNRSINSTSEYFPFFAFFPLLTKNRDHNIIRI